MSTLITALFCALVIATAGFYIQSTDSAVHEFVVRCEAKGGLALKATTLEHSNWLGCYKGVVEIENEVAQ